MESLWSKEVVSRRCRRSTKITTQISYYVQDTGWSLLFFFFFFSSSSSSPLEPKRLFIPLILHLVYIFIFFKIFSFFQFFVVGWWFGMWGRMLFSLKCFAVLQLEGYRSTFEIWSCLTKTIRPKRSHLIFDRIYIRILTLVQPIASSETDHEISHQRKSDFIQKDRF